MISGLRSYRDMKETDTPVGCIPAHWDVAPVSRIGQLFKGTGGSKDDEVDAGVPCIRYGDLYTQHEFFIQRSRGFVSSNRANSYTQIRSGDVLFAASGETIEDIGRSAVNLINDEARCGGDVIVLRPQSDVLPRYLGYAADSPAAREQKTKMGRGFTIVHIYASELKRLMLPFPPRPEQAAIVRFLDHADDRIGRYIRAKQKLVKLLEEQKQAIIHRAVTRGLDPRVRLKPSGVEWLGDLPEHWAVRRLKSVCTRSALYGANVPASAYTTEGVRFLRTTDITEGGDLKSVGVCVPAELVTEYMLSDGDLLISRSGTVGRSFAYDAASHGPCAYAGYLVRFVPDPQAVSARFVYLFMRSDLFAGFLRSAAIVSTIENVSGAKYANAHIPVPSLGEQAEIVAAVDGGCRPLVIAVENARREINLMREYRIRLIDDVVTGKLDVREAAARLPGEPDEAEPFDEIDTPPADTDDDAAEHAELEELAV